MLNLSPLRPLYAIERKRDLPGAFNDARAALSRVAWQEFAPDYDSGPIAKTGVVWQPLPDTWAQRFFSILQGSEPTRLHRGDYVDGYMATLDDLIINYLNYVNDYRAVTPQFLSAVQEFLDEGGARQLTHWLGHRWRVCSIRQFNLNPTTMEGSRHLDGWPPAIRKIFILPGGAGADSGTTWFRLRDGSELLFNHPSPCWVVFENNTVEHAMMAGKGIRPTIELDIVPARETSTVPLDAGLNGWYPWFPEKSASWHFAAAKQSLRKDT